MIRKSKDEKQKFKIVFLFLPDASQTQTAINSIDNALFAYPVANTVRIQEAGEATGLTPEQLLIQETTPDEDGTIFPFSLAVTPVKQIRNVKIIKGFTWRKS